MQASGNLKKNRVILKKSKEIGRFYSKSDLGTLLTNTTLELNVIEAAYLLGEKKLQIFQNKKKIDFPEFIKIAQQEIADFEIKYLVFKDLRCRGYNCRLYRTDSEFSFVIKKKQDTKSWNITYIVAFSERDIFDSEQTRNHINISKKEKALLWYAIVDEEGDITYYEITSFSPSGCIQEQHYPKATGVLFKERILLFDKPLSKQLFNQEFYGKPFGDGLQLSLVEGLYLLKKGVLSLKTSSEASLSPTTFVQRSKTIQPDIEQRLLVFHDLKKRGLLVKTGFKFGAHFRAYTKKPDATHAEYLIHVMKKGFTGHWAEVSRAIRLAHSVNKDIFFARVERNIVEYMKLGRLKP